MNRELQRMVGRAVTGGHDILLVGGYGVVGRRIAARLAPEFPDRVVVAGRHIESARALCQTLGHGAKAREIDVQDVESVVHALTGIRVVVACVAQRDLALLRQSVTRGLAYTDISPRLSHWMPDSKLIDEAVRTGARIVLGAGLSPGISNLMARQMATEVGPLASIETDILLSIGDEYGPDSLHHLVDSIAEPFSLRERGRSRPGQAFTEGSSVAFPPPIGPRTAYLFPWSDGVNYPRTLGAQTSIGRFSLEPAWLGHAVALLVRVGARTSLQQFAGVGGERAPFNRLKRLCAVRDTYALMVRVTGERGVRRMSLVGRRQADATAAGAAAIVHALATNEMSQAGVFLPEQVIEHEPFFERIARWGYGETSGLNVLSRAQGS